MTRPLLGFAEISRAFLVTFAQSVFTGFTANPYFPAPPVSLPDFLAAIQLLIDTNAAAYKGSVLQTQQAKDAQAALIRILRLLADYVKNIANGDREKILSSGFLASADGSVPIAIPDMTTGLKFDVNTTPGQATIDSDGVPRAHTYIILISDDQTALQAVTFSGQDGRLIVPANVAVLISFTKKKVISNLQEGILYYFTAYSMNSAGHSAPCAIISIRVPAAV